MNKIILLLCASLLVLTSNLYAQSDTTSLLSALGETPDAIDWSRNAFKANRVINGHSTENTAMGVLDFKISHRFGYLNGGLYEMFGIDQASMRIGGDYGITDRLQVGLGRSTYKKTYDGYVKYKILWQHSGGGKPSMPISLSWISGMTIQSLKWTQPSRDNLFSSRVSYFHQAIIARKFSDNFSLQLMPTVVHRNLTATKAEKNDVWIMGAGLRYKIAKRLAITGEYFYAFPNQLASSFYNSASLGVDIETGGHVFQIQFTNSAPMIEPAFLTETLGRWGKGDIRIGFNISRVFTIVRPKSLD